MNTIVTLSIIVGFTGVIPKNLLKCIREMGFNEHIHKNLQKVVLLTTVRTITKTPKSSRRECESRQAEYNNNNAEMENYYLVVLEKFISYSSSSSFVFSGFY